MKQLRSLAVLGACLALLVSCRNNDTQNAVNNKAAAAAIADSFASPEAEAPDSFPKAPSGDSIYEAALSGMQSEVMRMLDDGFDINARDEDGRTVLMYASYDGHSGLIRDLLNRGAKVDLRDVNGRTALMLAASGPFPDAVKLLLERNADPNLTDTEEHFTALMYAAAEGQLDVVKVLMKYNADPRLKDADGDDAVTFARNNGHPGVAEFLNTYTK